MLREVGNTVDRPEDERGEGRGDVLDYNVLLDGVEGRYVDM